LKFEILKKDKFELKFKNQNDFKIKSGATADIGHHSDLFYSTIGDFVPWKLYKYKDKLVKTTTLNQNNIVAQLARTQLKLLAS
jgi:hypothetical protein